MRNRGLTERSGGTFIVGKIIGSDKVCQNVGNLIMVQRNKTTCWLYFWSIPKIYKLVHQTNLNTKNLLSMLTIRNRKVKTNKA